MISEIFKAKDDVGSELNNLRQSKVSTERVGVNRLAVLGRIADNRRLKFGARQQVTKIFDRDLLGELIQEIALEKSTTDGRRRELADYERLYASPAVRIAATITENYQAQLDELAESMPNMSHAIKGVIAPELSVNNFKVDRGFLIQPLLLLGPAGCGKSYLASALSTMMNTPTLEIKAETQQSSASLCGSAKHWSNAQAGSLFNLMCKSHVSNGIVFVDEIDKSRGTGDYPFINSLYALLEPTTATKFQDNACPEIQIDLSQLSWIFTANSTDVIPQPLMSRLNVIEVAALKKSEARNVAFTIFKKQCEIYLGPETKIEICSSALDVLQNESPRKQTLMLRTALGKLLLEKSQKLNATHLPSMTKEAPSRIGFI